MGTISADELAAEVASARQVAHEEGMRAGLAALDAYKRNHAEAMAAQMDTAWISGSASSSSTVA